MKRKGLNMTFAEADAHQRKHGFKPLQEVMDFVKRGQKAQAEVNKLLGAPTPNKTEAEFGRILEAQKAKHEILRYEFHGITLRFGSLKYTPDWFVIVCNAHDWDGVMTDWRQLVKLRCIEVKGERVPPTFRQHAIARFKGARDAYPEFEFQFHQKVNGVWTQIA